MADPQFILIENGDLYDPEPRGHQSVLLAGDRVVRVGGVDRRALDRLGVSHEVIDATGMYVTPGFIDPHQHLLGGSGEGSPSLQTPMLFLTEIARAGITTVVGVLGVDTTMKTMAGLLARVKGLAKEGLTTRMWSGGYNVPPTTVMGSIREDMLFIDEVIGAGEIAISDERGLNQSAQALATLVRDTHVGGLLSGKSGVTHFHVGEEETRLQPLRALIEEFRCKPEWLYPTHVQRNATLLDEAIALARQGVTIDFDVAAEDLARWVAHYREHDGPWKRLTVSSDSDSGTPDMFHEQLRGLVLKEDVPLEQMLALVTTNPARVLKLPGKGRVAEGCAGDVLVLDQADLGVCEVIAGGKRLVKDGTPVVREHFLAESSRHWQLEGEKIPERRV